ncbi:MAG: 3-hydroxyacyl-CoA dehydrogenase family protein [Planctomycetota bacterium]|nr:MAG: 3-hydroxyacyl-CoA dehydrogenase family protein [Planctomycetota bacterium]
MKQADSIQSCAVLGAGTMGHGIAQICAQSGMEVRLFDVAEQALQKGMAGIDRMLNKAVEKGKATREDSDQALARISTTTDLAKACAQVDLVIEAVPERLDLKKSLFQQVEAVVDGDCLLASNTSSLSINALAEVVQKPDRFLGLHFFNPVPLMPLLEIVIGGKTAESSIACAQDLGRRWGKQPIVVRDAPGFASSRLGIAIAMEAIRMVEEEVASPADIDTAMELGYRHPMGPLKLTDLVGLDVRLGIAEYLSRELGPRFEPPQLLRDMVAEGRLGKKVGRGFYEW